MNRVRTAVAVAASFAVPLLAHHSPASMYDVSRTVTIEGTVSEVQWLNPHAQFVLNVTGTNGKAIAWKVELPAPHALIQLGWKKADLKTGDHISVVVWVAKDGSAVADTRSLTLSDGRVLSGKWIWDRVIP